MVWERLELSVRTELFVRVVVPGRRIPEVLGRVVVFPEGRTVGRVLGLLLLLSGLL